MPCVVRLVAIAALAAVVSACERPEVGRNDGVVPSTNVIIISLDTTRPDYLGCYGHPWVKTPNLDRLANEGILFEHAYAPISHTLPSHTSIMTGSYPHTHGVPRNGFWVDEENETLAEILRAAGYPTAGFVSAPVLGTRFNFAQGFEHFDEETGVRRAAGDAPGTLSERSAEGTTKAALAHLDQTANEQPRFLFVHYFDPHHPYLPPPEFVAQYADLPDIPPPGSMEAYAETRLRALTDADDSSDFPRLLYLYAAEISYTDHWIGRLLDGLEARGLLDDSLLIVTSDHGETLWDEKPYFMHGFTTHDAEARVIGLVRLPGGAHAGARVETPVSTIDWMPSILGFLNLPEPTRVDGRDLRLASGATQLEPVDVFGQACLPMPTDSEALWPNAVLDTAVVAYPYKLRIPHGGSVPVFSILGAANEADHDTARERMTRAIDVWERDADPLPIVDAASVDAEARKALHALGYN